MSDQPISLADLLGLSIDLCVVDVGANPIDGVAPYRGLLDNGLATVFGFEPNAKALAVLQQQKGPRETYLPHAVGDGGRHVLHYCRAPGMTSLLEPNQELLRHFHGFPQWGEVVSTEEVETIRLDDVTEIPDLDFLKMDIQGAELMVLRHAARQLSKCVVVQTEAEFLPLYKGQPLFSEVEQYLRAAGFLFHKFAPLESRVIAPMLLDNDIYRGHSQIVWADAVFVRDFTKLSDIPNHKLLNMATLLHDIYGSHDMVLHVLREFDRRGSTTHSQRYLAEVTSILAS